MSGGGALKNVFEVSQLGSVRAWSSTDTLMHCVCVCVSVCLGDCATCPGIDLRHSFQQLHSTAWHKQTLMDLSGSLWVAISLF